MKKKAANLNPAVPEISTIIHGLHFFFFFLFRGVVVKYVLIYDFFMFNSGRKHIT